MPVYNIIRIKGNFLSAVHSVLKQTHRDLELILVNDGSKDDTHKVLQRLAEADHRVRVVEKQNGGVESARRKGLEEARGQYVVHMDQDDLYRHDAMQVMLQGMQQTGADVLVAASRRFVVSRHFAFGSTAAPSMQQERVVGHDEFMTRYYRSFFGINDLPVHIWNKMYSKAFIDRSPVPPLTGHIIEDLSYNMHLLPYAHSICILPQHLYYYRWGGYTSHYDPTILDTALTGYRLKMNEIAHWQLPGNFVHSTAIELLNYLNSYFSDLVVYNLAGEEQFLAEAKRVLALPEATAAADTVRRHDTYHREHIDAMLAADCQRLYDHELAMKKANWKRIWLKKLILRP